MMKLFEEFNLFNNKSPNYSNEKIEKIEKVEVIDSYFDWVENFLGKNFSSIRAIRLMNMKFAGKVISIKNFENGEKWRVEYVDCIIKIDNNILYHQWRLKKDGHPNRFLIPNDNDEITIYPDQRYYTKDDPYGEEDWLED